MLFKKKTEQTDTKPKKIEDIKLKIQNMHLKEKSKRLFSNFGQTFIRISKKLFLRSSVEKLGQTLIIGFYRAKSLLQTAFKLLVKIPTCPNAIKYYKKTGRFLKRNWGAVTAAFIVVSVLIFGNNFALALKVSYNGDVVGYVNNEKEIDEVVNKVEGDMQNRIGENYALKKAPEYSITVVKKENISEEDTLYNEFINKAKEDVGNSYGLIVDGKLIGTYPEKEPLQKILDDIINPYKSEGDNVEFIKDVKVVKGMYPETAAKSIDEFKTMINTRSANSVYTVEEGDNLITIAKKIGLTYSDLKKLNPDINETRMQIGSKINIARPELYLGVKKVKEVLYTEPIPYDTKKQETSSLYKGQTKIKKEGELGKREVLKKVTYIDGVEDSKEELSSKILKEPEDRVLLVGTKKRPSSSSYSSGSYKDSGSGYGTGSLMRPVSGGYISSPYGYRSRGYHPAIDIACPRGTRISAADSGTVTFAGRRGSYGKLVIINHGNGIVTWYAHCSSINVRAGQKVSKGQKIAAVGSTGNSTGNHVHFEVHVNGRTQNPLRYIG